MPVTGVSPVGGMESVVWFVGCPDGHAGFSYPATMFGEDLV